MSLKEDIVAVKQELDAEEKFLESQVKAERFFKKYKNPLIGLAACVVMGAISFGGYTLFDNYQNKKANEALLVLLANPKDTNALETLSSSNHKLYLAYELNGAIQANDVSTLEMISKENVDVISDIAAYHLATLKKDKALLSQYSSMDDHLYKDLALITSAKIALDENNTKKAKEYLSRVPMESQLKDFANAIEHFTIKGIQ